MMEVKDGQRLIKLIKLIQVITEPNIWRIVEEGPQKKDQDGKEEEREETLRGLLPVYVDDLLVVRDGLLVVREQSTIHLVVDRIQQTWEVSKPEVVSDQVGTRFLGMELWRKEEEPG